MRSFSSSFLQVALLALALAMMPIPQAFAEQKAASPVGALGGSGKEPIKIDADRLDVYDKENKAIFAGNVVAVQGDATIRCTALTVYYKRGSKDDAKKDNAKKDTAKDGEAEAEKTQSSMAENGIRKVECTGPVTVKQKDQVATGDNAVFDQEAKKIILTGNVVLSQCQNVTRGSRLTYDMNSGRANMDPGTTTGRVSAMFVPGEKSDAKSGKGCASPAVAGKPAPKPDTAPRAQAN